MIYSLPVGWLFVSGVTVTSGDASAGRRENLDAGRRD